MSSALTKAISLGLVLSLFLLRPSALGQDYSSLGLVAVVTFALLYVLLSGMHLQTDKAIKSDFSVLIMLAGAYVIYEIALALIFGRSNLDHFFKEVVLTTVALAGYGLFLVNFRNNVLFFRQFTTVVSLLGWSSAITLAMAAFTGLDALVMFSFTMTGYEFKKEAGVVYFPLSMGYSGLTSIGDFSLFRFAGFFREAGIYQAVAAFCLILASLHDRSWRIRLGLVLGIVCTFSTIGIAMLLAALGIAYLLKHRVTVRTLVFGGLLIAGGAYAAVYAPVIGLADKSELFSLSVDDRLNAVSTSIAKVADNPLGTGPFSGKEVNEGINLIASMSAIGILGFVLQVLLLSGFRGRFDKITVRRTAACVPILITALASQPIAASPIMYVLVMVWLGAVPRSENRQSPRALVKLDVSPLGSH